MRRNFEDYNLRVRLVALLVMLTLGALALWRLQADRPGVVLANHVEAPAAPVKAFQGGTFEASGVVHVPGSDGVLFVDDGRTDEVFWMRVGAGRNQSGAIKAINLGASVIDLEGITTDGTHFYVVGSQSKTEGGDMAGLVRFAFDPARQRIDGVVSISGLKSFLAENVAELRGMGDRKYKDGGINIEGIAWNPRGGTLLLGLRSPVVDGHALVVPLRLRDARGAFSVDNLKVERAQAIRLPLGGAGIRSIEFDERRNAFRVLSGAAANSEKSDFKLWEWDGDAARPGLRETGEFDSSLKPEGVTRVATTGGRDYTFIVFDTSAYAAMD
jgi:hypothetical protein